jgi:beta-lactamase regulating signal transducer with metallopeptidase domain
MNSLYTSWQLAGWTMILFLAVGTVLLIIAGAVRLLLRRTNANARYGASLMSFVLLAALPVMIAGTLLASRGQPRASATGQRPEELTTKDTKVTKIELNAEVAMASPERQRRELATEVTESTEKIGKSNVAATPNAPFDFEGFLFEGIDYLPWVWIIGTPLTFLLLASGLIGAERLRRSCKLLVDGPIHAACEELRDALRISRKVSVAICDSIASPLVVGIVKPLILLPPAALTGWSPEHLEMVLVHELAHVRRWDNAVNLFQRIVESLLFFHPAVWIVSGWVRRDREDCCDAIVVRHTAKPQAYAELLLNLASSTRGMAASAAMAQHPLAGRIRRILKLQDEPMLVSRQALGFLGSAVLACVLAVAFFAPSEAEESVSRETSRSEAERSEASRKRQRPEETTKNTKDTKEDLATEDTESTEKELNARSSWEAEDASAAENSLTEYTIVYEVKGSGAKFAELIDHLRGMSEFKVTSSNDDQIVVMARRSVHKRVAEYLDFLRGIHEQPMKFANTANRPIIYAEQTEKLSSGLYKYSFLVPWVRAVEDPVRRATTEALIKSDLLLSRAIKEMSLLTDDQSSFIEYLQKELSVHYSPEGHMFVALTGAKEGEGAVAAYAAAIINEYLAEHLTHQAKNQHDLATEDYRQSGEESVSSDVESSAAERASETTTKNTKDTKEDLATEDKDKDAERGVTSYPNGGFREVIEKVEGSDEVRIHRIYTLGEDEAELKRLLKAIDELSDEINLITKDGKELAVVTGTQHGHDILVQELERRRGNTSDGKFPTLEGQRAADLAYKLLGLELAKLSPEELARVKAKGYQGGLRVDRDNLEYGIGTGNLLVGLHVWPTESLEQIQEILTRNDLDQLSPMKFYVVRSVDPHSDQPQPDEVVTGRLPVELGPWRVIRDQNREKKLQQLISIQKEVQDDLVQKEKFRDTGNVKNRDMLDAEIGQLREILEKLSEQVEGMKSQVSDEKLTTARQPSILELKREIASMVHHRFQLEAVEGTNKDRVRLDTSIVEARGLLKQLEDEASQAGEEHDNAAEPQDIYMPVDPNAKVDLSESRVVVYDGKTFDEWRQMWRSELKTEKRTECIKALAAFARVGMGPDAAEAILDVAGEYDFGKGEDSSATSLKSAISEVLTGYVGIDGEYWLPLYIERLNTDPEKWGSFADWVLSDVSGKDVVPMLKKIASNGEYSEMVRGYALAGLTAQPDIANDEESLAMIRAALAPQQFYPIGWPILLKLRFTQLEMYPEQIELLFHKDEQTREKVMNVLFHVLNSDSYGLIADRLLAVIDDPERKADHAQAIELLPRTKMSLNSQEGRAHRNKILGTLGNLLVNGDEEILPVTLRTMSSLATRPMHEIIEKLGDRVTDERREELEQVAKKIEDEQREEDDVRF